MPDRALPQIGLGTWHLTGEKCSEIVSQALSLGYPHIDTAQIYGNESEVGAGIAASGVSRDSFFLTTKVWIENFAPGDFERSVDQSLKRLSVDSVDLLLLHWPSKEHPLPETIGLLVSALEEGKAKTIGVSNFTIPMLTEALSLSKNRIVTNQIEYHPMLDQKNQLRFCRENGLTLTAYSPLCRGKVLKHPIVLKVAESHEASAAQVVLAWLMQQDGVVVIPKTSTPERLKPNLESQKLTLSEQDCLQIAKLATRDGRRVNPDSIAPDWSEDE